MSLQDNRRSRVAVSIIFSINGFLYANWVARLPRFQETYGLDHGELGLVLLASSIGALIAMPLTGKVIVQAGSDKITKLMLILFCLCTPLLALMPNPGLGLVSIGRCIGFARCSHECAGCSGRAEAT